MALTPSCPSMHGRYIHNDRKLEYTSNAEMRYTGSMGRLHTRLVSLAHASCRDGGNTIQNNEILVANVDWGAVKLSRVMRGQSAKFVLYRPGIATCSK